MTNLEKYYSKFKEENRLKTRHGTVEFLTSMKYIHEIINNRRDVKILDVGAATGAYSVPLAKEGFDVTAVELVRHNLEILRSKHENVKTWQGNAKNLSFLDDATFDLTILFGPMYHLHTQDDRAQVFSEARRVTKKGGFIFVSYIMNEYAVLQYCFGEGKLAECLEKNSLSKDFHTISKDDDLYSYVRLEDINALNARCGLERVKIFAQDGPSDYMRQTLNAMSEETFSKFIEYHFATCERPELLGASSHICDVLRN